MKPNNVDTQKMAEEIKKFIQAKKFDCVDYGYTQIEIYPPNSEDYPETRKFSAQWAEFFDNAEKALALCTEEPGEITFGEVLAKYSPNMDGDLEAFDEQTAAVASAVNSDAKFWEDLRGVVLPLYEKSPYYDEWKTRWKSVSISYDPTSLDVVTTQMWTNKKTGERTRGEKIRATEYPAGFIVKIN